MAKVPEAILLTPGFLLDGVNSLRLVLWQYNCLSHGQDVVTAVPAAKKLFETAADILGYDLLKICVEGKQAGVICKVAEAAFTYELDHPHYLLNRSQG